MTTPSFIRVVPCAKMKPGRWDAVGEGGVGPAAIIPTMEMEASRIAMPEATSRRALPGLFELPGPRPVPFPVRSMGDPAPHLSCRYILLPVRLSNVITANESSEQQVDQGPGHEPLSDRYGGLGFHPLERCWQRSRGGPSPGA